MPATDKYEDLLSRLTELDSVLVAYSGGVDSTLLAVAAHAVLGDRTLAVLACSDTYPPSEADRARELAADLGLNLFEIETFELADPMFAANGPDRCYHCKSELFGMLKRIADVRGLTWLADGSNADDAAERRPGARALAELGVISPLQDAGLTKAEIREISRDLGLPNWDKPSMTCLATRFPYGQRITEDAVSRVGRAEEQLRQMGLGPLRVRSHGDLARVEFSTDALDVTWAMRDRVSDALKAAGFTWVAFDADGYRSGSLDEALPPDA